MTNIDINRNILTGEACGDKNAAMLNAIRNWRRYTEYLHNNILQEDKILFDATRFANINCEGTKELRFETAKKIGEDLELFKKMETEYYSMMRVSKKTHLMNNTPYNITASTHKRGYNRNNEWIKDTWENDIIKNMTPDSFDKLHEECKKIIKEYGTKKDYRYKHILADYTRNYTFDEDAGDGKFHYKKYIEENTNKSLKNSISEEVAAEIRLAVDKGWYIFLDTVTVTDNNYKYVFGKGSRLRTSYLLDVRVDVLRACFPEYQEIDKYNKKLKGTRKLRSMKADEVYNYYRSFGVTEYGDENGRMHCHFIHLCKEMPVGIVDPNTTTMVHEKKPFVEYNRWRHGIQYFVPCRFRNDAFTRAGWSDCPIMNENGLLEIRDSNPAALGNYLTKYIEKQEETEEWRTKLRQEKDWNIVIPRTMRTRHFGKKWVMDIIEETLTLREMIRITRNHCTWKPEKYEMKPSLKLIRCACIRLLRKSGIFGRIYLKLNTRPNLFKSSMTLLEYRTEMKLPRIKFGSLNRRSSRIEVIFDKIQNVMPDLHAEIRTPILGSIRL